ncbi:hypothetical protein ACA910_000475 [Epithemia clementina (nom. ined.)]
MYVRRQGIPSLDVPAIYRTIRRRFKFHYLSTDIGRHCIGVRLAGSSDGGVVRTFSSVETTTSPSSAKLQEKTVAKSPPPLFPWRHEGLDNLIPRVTPGTREFQTILPLIAPEMLMANVFMGESLWNVLLTGQWRRDLEEGMCYAFGRGVAGIVSNVYHVPLENVFQSSQPSSQSSAYDVSFIYNNKSSADFTTPINEDKSEDESKFSPEVEDMMTQPLRQLFRSAHASGTSQLRIRLELTPKVAFFNRLCGLPFVTKQQVEDQPDMLNDLFVNEDGQFKVDTRGLYDFLNENAARNFARNGKFETTLAAEALILCDENFCVWDADTGKVLQGREDSTPREAAHLVTFERSGIYEMGSGLLALPKVISLSNWQIADIDDLLGPKKWFHVVAPGNTPPDST